MLKIVFKNWFIFAILDETRFLSGNSTGLSNLFVKYLKSTPLGEVYEIRYIASRNLGK
jgi:hypothetical protein